MDAFKKNLSFLDLFLIDTVSFFDIFDYPLTLLEIYNFLYINGMEGENYSITDVKNALEKSPIIKHVIKSADGYYFLAGRAENIIARGEKYKIADKKLKRAQRFVRMARYVPFIEFIAVCNNLALLNAGEKSDIDLFIITRKKRLFFVRFWAMLISFVLGLRVTKNKQKDRICLSFFVSDDNLDLSEIALPGTDIYLIYWLAWLLPIYVDNLVYKKFIEKNMWVKKYLPNLLFNESSEPLLIGDTDSSRSFKNFFNFFLSGSFGWLIEKMLKYFQLAAMSAEKKQMAKKDDSQVIINEQMLKFHQNDRREYFRNQFEKKQKKILDNF